jgi:hypothetical protein
VVTSLAVLERHPPTAIRRYLAHHDRVLKQSPEDAESLLAMALCHLALGLHEPCAIYLRRLTDAHPAEPAAYLYGALLTFRGRRPRAATLDAVRAALGLLDTAEQLDPANGVYAACSAAVVHDYFVTNGMRIPPPGPDALIARARASAVLDGPLLARLLDGLALPDSAFRAALRALTS